MAQVITGAKAMIVFDVGGQIVPIAFAGSVTVTHENKLEEIPQLDNLTVAEYAENGHRCSITINYFKSITTNPQNPSEVSIFDARSLGLDFDNDPRRILLVPELIFYVMDGSALGAEGIANPNQVYYTAYGCKFEGGSGSIDARGVWQGVWNFKARYGVGI